MTLPILLSVPHAGLGVPEEVRRYCVLTPRQIEKDGLTAVPLHPR